MVASRVEHGLDPAWLEELAARDPVPHVYAAWDLRYHPESAEFFTLVEDGTPTAYLLIWRGNAAGAVVHWVGPARDPEPLLERLPPRPLTADVPEPLARAVAERRGPAIASRVYLMAADRRIPPDRLAPGRARQLHREDAPLLREFARRNPDPLTAAYGTVDPDVHATFGVVQDGAVVSLARITAWTPGAWIIGGVYTAPDRRGRGFARDATRAAMAAVIAAGARPALFVREENQAARHIYERLGFVARERHALLECRDPAAPSNAS